MSPPLLSMNLVSFPSGNETYEFSTGQASFSPADLQLQLGPHSYTLPVSGSLSASASLSLQFSRDEVMDEVVEFVETITSWNPPTGENLNAAASDLFDAASDAFGDLLEPIWNALSGFVEGVVDAFSGSTTADGAWSISIAPSNLSIVTHWCFGGVPVALPNPGYVGPLLPGWKLSVCDPWPHRYTGPPLVPYVHMSAPRVDLITAALVNEDNWERVEWDVSAQISETIEHMAQALQYVCPLANTISCQAQVSVAGVESLSIDTAALARELFGSRRPDAYWSLLSGVNLAQIARDAASGDLQGALQEIADSTATLATWVDACFPGATGWSATPTSVVGAVEDAFNDAVQLAVTSGTNTLRSLYGNGFPGTITQVRNALQDLAETYVQELSDVFDELRGQDVGNSFLVYGAILLQLLGNLDPRSLFDSLGDQLRELGDDLDACQWILDTLDYLIRDLSIGDLRPFHSSSLIQHALKVVIQALVPVWETASSIVGPWIEGLLGDGLVDQNRLPFMHEFAEVLSTALAGQE